MASKLAVAGIIEGNFTDEGLAAMSECQDLTTILAQELTLGIKNEVEDLSAVFKKMAILKPVAETERVPKTELEQSVLDETTEQQPHKTHEAYAAQTCQITGTSKAVPKKGPDNTICPENQFPSVFEIGFSQKKSNKKIKAVYVDPNQMSLFDFGIDIDAIPA